MMAFVLSSSPCHMPQEKIQSLIMNLFSIWKGERRRGQDGWDAPGRWAPGAGCHFYPWGQERKKTQDDKELPVQRRPGAESQPICRAEQLRPQVVQSKLPKW